MTAPKTKPHNRLIQSLEHLSKPSASPPQDTAGQSDNLTGSEDKLNVLSTDRDLRPSSRSDVSQTPNVAAIPDVLDSIVTDWEKVYSIAETNLSVSEREWLNLERPNAMDDSRNPLRSLMSIAEDSKKRMADKQWKLEDRNGRLIPVKDRVEEVLKSIDKYACIIDVEIQHSSEISTLIWAGIRFALQVSLNHFEALRHLEEAMEIIMTNMAFAQFYASLYTGFLQFGQSSDEVINKFRSDMEMALPGLYAAVLVVSVKAVGYFESGEASNYLKPFSITLKPYIDDIENSRRNLEKLAKAADMERTKDIFFNTKEILHIAKGLESDFEGLRKTWKEAAEDTKTLLRRKEDSCLSSLPRAHNAAFDSAVWENQPYCAEDTRTELLNTILDWSKASDPSDPTRTIFWLNGMAGTGKSTIARTIARECHRDQRLGASFFFSRGDEELSKAKKLFTTIAVQLSRSIPVLQPLIYESINNNPDIHTKGLGEQWKRLVLQPIKSLYRKSPLLQRLYVVVIDALDECEGEDDVRLIPSLLSQAADLLGIRLKILITSRPEFPIRHGFSDIPTHHHQDFVLHDMSLGVVEKDISIYLSNEFVGIRKFHYIPPDWPGNETIQLIARKSMGLFVYAAAVCRFLRHTKFDPVEHLERILQDTPHPLFTQELDKMYTDVLMYSVTKGCKESDKSELSGRFKLIVGSLVVLSSPLTARSINELVKERQDNTDALLDSLHSVLELLGTSSTFQQIRLVHPTFRDFLLDRERCKDDLFYINEQKAHEVLFFRCLELIQARLQRNLCDLHPGASADEADTEKLKSALPQSLRYACRYWIHHLLNSADELQYEEKVYLFLQDHFLHWLEVLSLMKMISEGIKMVRMLESKVASSGSDRLRQLSHNTRQFIVDHQSAIEKAPLQAYISALIFSPSNSVVRQLYGSNIPRWIKNSPQVENDWDFGHSDEINSVAFSPDGKLLASGSDDETVWLWDTVTGASRKVFEGKSGRVLSVALSLDGKLLASGSDLKTVRLWDTITGASRGILEGHSGKVNFVIFSPDGKLLASGSNDQTVRLWDATTGASRGNLKGHSHWVNSVAFSPDGKLLASGSWDKTVRLWDAAIGASREILEGHSGWVMSVAFSPDGKLLASGSSDRTARLWDVEKKESIGVFKMGSNVKYVSFSSDGTSLITSAGTRSLVSLPAVESQITLSSHELWNISNGWITYGSQKLVFVPVEFKAYMTRVHGNCIAWVDWGLKVNIMNFDPSALTE